MERPSGPESCPVEVIDLILTQVDRKDMRAYASASRTFRRQAAHLLLQRVTISRPSNILSLSAFIQSDLHSSGASSIRYLSFRALSFLSGWTKGQDYYAFIDPLLDILDSACNIQTLDLVDADSFLSICTHLVEAFAALPNVKELRIDMAMNELYNIQKIIHRFSSSPARIFLNLNTPPCHRTPFYLLAHPSMHNVTELRVANMSLDNTKQFPNDEIKVFPSMQTLVSSVSHYGTIILSRERALRAALRSANISDILTRMPNLRRLYLFGYDRFLCRLALPGDEDPDTWHTLDVLGSDFLALAELKPPVKFTALDIARFTFNDIKIEDRSADKYIPLILERYKPSRLRLKFDLQRYHVIHTPPASLFPPHTPFSHLWININPFHLLYASHDYEFERMDRDNYSFKREVFDMIDRVDVTHLVLHFEISSESELLPIGSTQDLRDIAHYITSRKEDSRIEFVSMRAGPLGHRAWKVDYVGERQPVLEELKSPEDFERNFLDECGFIDI